MCHNQPQAPQPEAQPVVAPVPQPDDEPDVTHVGTAPCIRLSLLLTPYSLLTTP
jgi:hypothetical protein